MAHIAHAPHPNFLSGPLRAVAEVYDSLLMSFEFRNRFEALNGMSDAQLAERGLERSEIARQVLRDLSDF